MKLPSCLWIVCCVLSLSVARGEDWPQFRGVNASGRPARELPLPSEIGPDKNVAWKTALPPGHSSPIIVGERIFLTAVRDEKQLVTIGLDKKTGKILWQAEAPHEKLEEIHSVGSHAQSTPCSDGERVVSFFGSCGLFCYDLNGKLLWKRPMGPFNNGFGAGSSPIIVDRLVILSQDHDTDSFLMAIDKQTGETVWRTDRSEFPRNYCTPVIWNVDGKKQIVVAATLRVVGYDLSTGKELWTVRGIARAVCMTPVIGEDNTLYVTSWAAGGDAGELIRLDPFEKYLASFDKNGNKIIEEAEATELPVRPRFSQIDRDKSGTLTETEYNYFRMLFDQSKNNVLAIKPGGVGDVTATHVLWSHSKLLPFCSSPIVYRNTLFTVKDGGILSSLNIGSGKPFKQGRVPATNEYYASPVAGDGKVYLLNDEGEATIVSAEGSWQVLSSVKFGESTYATPAIVDGRIYLRTAGHLYCFAK